MYTDNIDLFEVLTFVPLTVECSSSSCAAGTRCLTLETTGEEYCLPSCFDDNGGCGKEQICINQPIRGCNVGLEACSTVKCINRSGKRCSYVYV